MKCRTCGKPWKEEGNYIQRDCDCKIPEEKLCLNLGCGLDYKKSTKDTKYINIDKLPIKKDSYADFEEPNCLKFIKDNSVDEVLIYEVLEHINNLFGFMKEIWRVCKHNAEIYITVPYWTHNISVIDPTHVRFFNEGTFQFFTKKFYGAQKKQGTKASPIPIDFDFKIDNLIYIPDDNYKNTDKEELALLKETQINVIKQLSVCLLAIKR